MQGRRHRTALVTACSRSTWLKDPRGLPSKPLRQHLGRKLSAAADLLKLQQQSKTFSAHCPIRNSRVKQLLLKRALHQGMVDVR